jgi:esterase/lipase superfamily enzyme
MKDKNILFITNRKIDYLAEQEARQKKRVLRVEDVFLKEPAVALTYGTATVSTPANRDRGDQNYESQSDIQNPLAQFALKSWNFAQTPIEFQSLIAETETQSDARSQSPLLYVHGFDTSFNDAAERLAQILVDTNYRGHALLFSWPANDWLVGPNRGDYLHAAQISRASRPYLVHALSLLADSSDQPINVLAHSMGTD